MMLYSFKSYFGDFIHAFILWELIRQTGRCLKSRLAAWIHCLWCKWCFVKNLERNRKGNNKKRGGKKIKHVWIVWITTTVFFMVTCLCSFLVIHFMVVLSIGFSYLGLLDYFLVCEEISSLCFVIVIHLQPVRCMVQHKEPAQQDRLICVCDRSKIGRLYLL